MLGLALVLLLGVALPVAAQPRSDVLPRFEDSVVTAIDHYPTDLAWMGGDLLIATIGGVLFRLEGADPGATPQVVLDVSDRVGTGREQGMLGIVADPAFAATANRYLYVYYTRDEGGCSNTFGTPPPDPSRCFNRVSRFAVGDDGVVDPASEHPLIPFIAVGIPNHNGGDLAFGKDGMLYVSVGDGGVDTPGGTGKAQDLGDLHGKILRVRRDGTSPRSNPFAGKGSVACAKQPTGTAPAGKRCAEVFASGLRNPYRIAFDPSGRGNRFFINDVGESSWEEINLGKAGANYGWPMREGRCQLGDADGCAGKSPKRLTAPIHVYNHASGCRTITGGAVVPKGSDWGRSYKGAYLFGDWACGSVFALSPARNGKRYVAKRIAWPGDGDDIELTAMVFDRSGDTLYYTSQWDEQDRSEVRAIRRKG